MTNFVFLGRLGAAEPQSGTLGEYIFALNPYQAAEVHLSDFQAPGGPAAILHQTDKPKAVDKDPLVTFYLDPPGIEHNQRPGTWKFKYADHYIERALRIPYMYYRDSDFALKDEYGEPKFPRQLVLVRDYFLIGFEGGVAY